MPSETQAASDEADQVQSRVALTFTVPDPPAGGNVVALGAPIATWHLFVVGAVTDVVVLLQRANAIATMSARMPPRVQPARIGRAHCKPDAQAGAASEWWCPRRELCRGARSGPVYNAELPVEYHITQYELEQGALEIQYIEEFFGEFPRKKTAAEIVRRLKGRTHLILLANAPLPDDPGSVVPVSFKVAHEINRGEREPKLRDLVERLHDYVHFDGRRVLYTWIGGTRRDWRGQGHFRALTEQQEHWAIEQGFDEIVVKTKNKFYEMRGTLDHLRFEVVKYERNAADNAESKVYLSKKLLPELIERHRSARMVVEIKD